MEASTTGAVRTGATRTGTVSHGWVPTRKWFAALFAGLLTIGAHAVGSGGWDTSEWAEVLTLGSVLVTSYFVPNGDTPGGVPDATTT